MRIEPLLRDGWFDESTFNRRPSRFVFVAVFSLSLLLLPRRRCSLRKTSCLSSPACTRIPWVTASSRSHPETLPNTQSPRHTTIADRVLPTGFLFSKSYKLARTLFPLQSQTRLKSRGLFSLARSSQDFFSNCNPANFSSNRQSTKHSTVKHILAAQSKNAHISTW